MADTNWFNRLSFFIDENKRKIQLGLYSVAAVGFGYALRSIRPFKKFQNINEIPQAFIDRRIKLNGTVVDVDNITSILRVDHNPIFGSQLRKRKGSGLDVRISGINITSNGIIWLRHSLIDNCIHFSLLKRQKNEISCIVHFNRKNVAEELLKLGFATVDVIDHEIEDDNLYIKYYQRLLTLETRAEKRKLGIWANSEYSLKIRVKDRILNLLYVLFYKLKK